MKTTKKHRSPKATVIVIILVTLAGAALAFYANQKGSVFNAQPDNGTTAPADSADEAAAKSAIEQAAKAQADNQYDTAKTLYEKARTYYVKSNNLAKQAEIDAALNLLEVEKSTPAPAKPRLAGE